MEFYKIANDFLNSAGVSVSINYLRERLESHPQYPALISLTDILDEFQIENTAIRIQQKEKWKELETPFLAHVVFADGRTDFELISRQKDVGSVECFLGRWTGIALTLGANKKIKHEQHNEQYKKEKSSRIVKRSIISLTTLLFVIKQMIFFNPVVFTHFMLSIIGLGISCAIIARSMGLKSNIAELFCKIEESGCNKVLNSRLGRFAGNIGLGDITAIFFGSQMIYMTFSTHFETSQNLILLSSIQAFAFVFTPVSLIYQWRLKSWCRLCLTIVAIIWAQSANFIWHLFILESYSLEKIHQPLETYLLFAISIFFASFWIIVKPLIIKERENLPQKIRIRKWRQDPGWFHALLPLHKRIDDTIWDKEIFYGNPKGLLQIIIVSNPYCEYCATAHSELDAILKKHPEDIGVRIRFTLKSYTPSNENYKAVFEILNSYEQLVWKRKLDHESESMRRIISDWYEHPDLSVWKYHTHHYQNHNIIDGLIKKSIAWARAMEVHQTPAFFINGHEMPNPHTFRDLFLFISDYIEILRRENSVLP
ncbi:thioredoxin domain-containing protein [Maribacter sp. 4G9]|uniref:thioredoxin domain-containing protein n=1 Tax=Maribacter sp. 4G9 TaxID=1889777 RepID=UPI000C14C2F0|nr:thioredoxin domain-containing protein [Maribacter sp. 4G9]PIB38982.1 hypothetical protein BFP75_13805 [Maribacter sp. 4G9]